MDLTGYDNWKLATPPEYEESGPDPRDEGDEHGPDTLEEKRGDK